MKYILAAIVIILSAMFWHYMHKGKPTAKNSSEVSEPYTQEYHAEKRGSSAPEGLPPPPPQAPSAIQTGPVNPRASKMPLPPPPKPIPPKVK